MLLQKTLLCKKTLLRKVAGKWRQAFHQCFPKRSENTAFITALRNFEQAGAVSMVQIFANTFI